MYDFWPRGDDPYSKSARLNTKLALAGTAFILFGVWILVRAFSC